MTETFNEMAVKRLLVPFQNKIGLLLFDKFKGMPRHFHAATPPQSHCLFIT